MDKRLNVFIIDYRKIFFCINWKIGVIAAVVILVICAVPTSADEISGSDKNYIIISLYDYSNEKRAAPISGTIQQGETLVYQYEVITGKNKLGVQLEWKTDTANDLSLKIRNPRDRTHGPYKDLFDGKADHKIPVVVKGNPIQTGTWIIEIYGANIDKKESFTLLLNAV